MPFMEQRCVLDRHDNLTEIESDPRKFQGLSIAEATARGGTTPGALKIRPHRAYVALKAAFRKLASPHGDPGVANVATRLALAPAGAHRLYPHAIAKPTSRLDLQTTATIWCSSVGRLES